jgi:hypothetical protein
VGDRELREERHRSVVEQEAKSNERVPIYCPRSRDYTRQIVDPVNRHKVICTVCGLLFSLQDSNAAMVGLFEVWDGKYL